jgi:hypothetical protein
MPPSSSKGSVTDIDGVVATGRRLSLKTAIPWPSTESALALPPPKHATESAVIDGQDLIGQASQFVGQASTFWSSDDHPDPEVLCSSDGFRKVSITRQEHHSGTCPSAAEPDQIEHDERVNTLLHHLRAPGEVPCEFGPEQAGVKPHGAGRSIQRRCNWSSKRGRILLEMSQPQLDPRNGRNRMVVSALTRRRWMIRIEGPVIPIGPQEGPRKLWANRGGEPLDDTQRVRANTRPIPAERAGTTRSQVPDVHESQKLLLQLCNLICQSNGAPSGGPDAIIPKGDAL